MKNRLFLFIAVILCFLTLGMFDANEYGFTNLYIKPINYIDIYGKVKIDKNAFWQVEGGRENRGSDLFVIFTKNDFAQRLNFSVYKKGFLPKREKYTFLDLGLSQYYENAKYVILVPDLRGVWYEAKNFGRNLKLKAELLSSDNIETNYKVEHIFGKKFISFTLQGRFEQDDDSIDYYFTIKTNNYSLYYGKVVLEEYYDFSLRKIKRRWLVKLDFENEGIYYFYVNQ